ncbi:MAG: hypothetical protein DRI97_06305 [Bacteroidetes bacterium]|nr:MAG: hypothetical protein DRI97_06305 [Bacteroidota bacterium]
MKLDSEQLKAAKNLTEALLECVTILFSVEGKIYRKEKLMDYDLVNAAGEVTSPVSGKEYQIQVSIIRNKKMWVESDEVQKRIATNVRTIQDNVKEN